MTTTPHHVTLYNFTEAHLRDVLDTLGDNEYPIAKSLTHGEVEELGDWIRALAGEFKELVGMQARMFLETVEGRVERGVR